MPSKKLTEREVLTRMCEVIEKTGWSPDSQLMILAKEGRSALRNAPKTEKGTAGRPRRFNDEQKLQIASEKGSAESVGKRWKCSGSLVNQYRRELGIDPNAGGTEARRRQIANAVGTVIEVMQQFGCGPATVVNCRKEFGKSRQYKKSRAKKKT